ncbi:hypothetical protein CATYP_03800 [Corynebacterium atypicum]|uniref:Uncharacterized protein n=1 Tax=Corynebacterium atypicum TaxID=191610 RepID=A0ABN4DCE8_9CORY|nr:hypothetical protein [Corynebacterium atypicum]AIG63920.1 hypothetical protein CATYP_03800 [Corynebacterium atypicum]
MTLKGLHASLHVFFGELKGDVGTRITGDQEGTDLPCGQSFFFTELAKYPGVSSIPARIKGR